MNKLPTEILEEIFCYTSPDTFVVCTRVCQRWRDVSYSSKILLSKTIDKLINIDKQQPEAKQLEVQYREASSLSLQQLHFIFDKEASSLCLGAGLLSKPRFRSLSSVQWMNEEIKRIFAEGMTKMSTMQMEKDKGVTLLVPHGCTITEYSYTCQTHPENDVQARYSMEKKFECLQDFSQFNDDCGGNGLRCNDKDGCDECSTPAQPITGVQGLDIRKNGNLPPGSNISSISAVTQATYGKYATLQTNGSVMLFVSKVPIPLRQQLYSCRHALSLAVKSRGHIAALYRNELVLVNPGAEPISKPSPQYKLPSNFPTKRRLPIHRIPLDSKDGPGESAARLRFARGDMQLVLYPAHSPIHTHFTYGTETPFLYPNDDVSETPPFIANKCYFHNRFYEDGTRAPSRATTLSNLGFYDDPLATTATDRYLQLGNIICWRHETATHNVCVITFIAIVLDSYTKQFMLAVGEMKRPQLSCTHRASEHLGYICPFWIPVAVIEGLNEQELVDMCERDGAKSSNFVVAPTPLGDKEEEAEATGGGQEEGWYQSLAFSCGKSVFVVRINASALLAKATDLDMGDDTDLYVYSWQKFTCQEDVSNIVWFGGHVLTVFCVTGLYHIGLRERRSAQGVCMPFE